MKHEKLQKMVLAALFAALTYVATNIIHIPTPATNGYINLGDCMVLLGAFLLGPVWGAAAGGIGSMLADVLLGYFSYAPGTMPCTEVQPSGVSPLRLVPTGNQSTRQKSSVSSARSTVITTGKKGRDLL